MPPSTASYTEDQKNIDTEKIQLKAKASQSDSPEITKWESWFNEARELRREKDQRWAKNIKLLRGIWPDDELSRSKVRKRSKIFFRKIWASNWRLLAAMHDAFLREADQFRVVGRMGEDGDEDKADILQIMTEYRRDLMMKQESLFLQLIWSIMTILDLGWACAKLGWRFDKEKGIDRPEFTLYPNEQVYPDMSATLPHKMRFLFFENYLTADEMEEEGYDPAGCDSYGSVENIVRAARFQQGQRDPLAYSDTNTNQAYPQPGSAGDIDKKTMRARYCVKELFYKEDGKIMFAVYCGHKILRSPMDSPYGERYPSVFGQCLTLAHQLMGEGFPEPQEGPQTSLNVTLNQRKDNVSIMMNGESVVDRYANVDLEALRTSRPANVILSDNPDAVKPLIKSDVTQNAWMEASADMGMMDETSGVTPGLSGMDKSQKATTSQINFQNAGAKVGLYISIVAQTFFRDFFTQLAYMIQRFETDEKIFKVANKSLKALRTEKGKAAPAKDIDTIDDFTADIDVQVQPDMATKEQEVRNMMLAMDRAIMSNQALVPLVQGGIVPEEGISLFNISAFMKPIMDKLGQKNFNKFVIKIPKAAVPPPAPPNAGGGKPGGRATQAAAGAATAQAETPDIIPTASTPTQDIQGGNAGATQ